ncbi:MAG: hypothetical protein A4E66_02155 [Syntrophus sp. PtaB.Bin001]|nr:MAG: hypothetical protein A4E66_02155 [Syntrophus sp. PtaB.Bin001]
MPRLEVGDIVDTNYNTGPYRITSIERGARKRQNEFNSRRA